METTPEIHRQAIIITGPVGAGKTTVMATLADVLEQHSQPVAAIDMDMLRWFYPRQPGDPFGGFVGRQHLAFMAANYRTLGISTLVVADVIENYHDREAMVEALPGFTVQVIRLQVPMDLIDQRLRQRDSGEHLQWCLERAPELQHIMEAANVGDTVIDVGTRTPWEIANEIARRLGLI